VTTRLLPHLPHTAPTTLGRPLTCENSTDQDRWGKNCPNDLERQTKPQVRRGAPTAPYYVGALGWGTATSGQQHDDPDDERESIHAPYCMCEHCPTKRQET
jgi:hypothetical protein